MVKQKIIIEDIIHLYEHTFDEFIDKYQPLRDADEKRYIKVYKYPIIFAILPTIMKKKYSNLSIASIQIYATRLGLSIIDHDDRIKLQKEQYNTVMFDTSPENIGIADLLRCKIPYTYSTESSNNGYIYLATSEDVKSYISEYGDCFGMPDYQIALGMFLLGIKTATMKEYHNQLVSQEIVRFWKVIGLRGKQLK